MSAIRGATGATDLRWVSGYVSVREAGTGPLPWHQDWWSWDHPLSFDPDAAQVAVLCYLDDTSEANAALCVVPGSHRQLTALHGTIDASGAATGQPADGQVVAVRAGDVVVLDYRLLHATTANASPRRRDAILLNFAPRWSSLPPEIRGHFVSHLALAGGAEDPERRRWAINLLPTFDGSRRDLPLDRRPARCASADRF